MSLMVPAEPLLLTRRDRVWRVRIGVMMLAVCIGFGLIVAVSAPWNQRLPGQAPAVSQNAKDLAAFRKLLQTEPVPVVEPVELPALPPERAREVNAAIPFVTGPIPAARPFRSQLAGAERDRATDCLASAMWYETGVDWDGQLAVAQVVLNRVRHPAFPHSVCGVVFQGSERATGCQFSFTCDGSLARVPPDWAWQRTRAQAKIALNGAVYGAVGLATHYHTDWVAPYWNSELDKIAAVRTHLFFRWKGNWGRQVAFMVPPSAIEPVIASLAALSAAHQPPAADGVTAVPPVAPLAALTTGALASLTMARPDDRAMIATLPASRGARVALIHPDGDAFILQYDADTRPGAYALAALDLCKGKSFCKVMGWRDAAMVPANFPISADADHAMTFVYLYQNGQEYMGWNCSQIAHPPGDRCREPGSEGWGKTGVPVR